MVEEAAELTASTPTTIGEKVSSPSKKHDDQLSQINEVNEEMSVDNQASRANLLQPSASL